MWHNFLFKLAKEIFLLLYFATIMKYAVINQANDMEDISVQRKTNRFRSEMSRVIIEKEDTHS